MQESGRMKTFFKIFTIAASLFFCLPGKAAVQADDVFTPIAKYLAQGNTESLSAWFADNLDMSIISQEGSASKSQAKQILQTFFESYTPRSFTITHTAGRATMKYAVGELHAGGERFHVTIFVSLQGGTYRIQQLSIKRA